MKYAKDNGIETYERRFMDNVASAKQLAEEFDFKLPTPIDVSVRGMDEELRAAAKLASDGAGKHLEVLKSEISTSIDTNTSEGRATMKTAVSVARGLLTQGAKGIPLFQIWKALTDAANDTNFVNLPMLLSTATTNLNHALDWHDRQIADGKLRLKALAAQTFLPVRDKDANCPLCLSLLNDNDKRALALELEELKTNSDAAERKIDDACLSIQQSIIAAVPTTLRIWRTTIDLMKPAEAYAAAMREKFVLDEPFSNVLIGLAASANEAIEVQKGMLPNFSYPEFKPSEGEPEAATKLRHEIHALERLIALVDWWKRARPIFGDAWSALIGKKLDNGIFPIESVEVKLSVLEQALDHARPLDDLSKYLANAAAAATTWAQIDAVQKTREAIKDALEQLKQLRTLVTTETASSIAALSDKINAIGERISLKERLTYQEATIGRKEVSVAGSFSPGMRIDAALVANTSWLRAILWSFVFALREETLNAIGFNPLPLVVLDDPQTTFDPRNKRKWAQELVRSANLPSTDLLSSQLIVTTHERSFYQMMVDHEKLVAQQGLIGGVNKISGVATVANGGELRRIYDEARKSNDDAKAREYIRKVRIYCEDLMKFMLRSISRQIPDMTLGQLKEELKRLGKDHVAPFDRRPFDALVNALSESQKAIQYLNDPHHKDDESFGVAEADVVNGYWDKTLLDKIHVAFSAFDTFELYTGEPRTFPWAKNVVKFPFGYRTNVKESEMRQTGVAAAAKTDGRAGDGILTVKEWDAGDKIVLPNHDVFQLAAGTLDPVAGIGDLIIVSNYAKINPRNLVVAVSGNALLARRLNRPENHSEIFVLTGQAIDPTAIPEPIIVAPDTDFRKIVGTLFTAHLLPIPAINQEREFVAIPDPSILDKTLKGARLFKVEGRSAEPIALDGQFLITRDKSVKVDAISSLNGRLIVAIDEDGARYFKRLRCHDKLVVLESLNPEALIASEVLSLDGSQSLPRITEALEVIGVLFELPDSSGSSK
jgi:SOS-response transcriptional repressor LexA